MRDPLPSHELAAFAAAVETGTVHGAAEALSLTQSAATKRIAALERRLEVRLLDRSRRGVVPTEAGRLVYPEAKHALSALAAAERVARERAGAAAVLRLAASQTLGEFLVPGWLAAFRASGDPGHVQLHIGNSPAVLRELAEGIVDIGFVEGNDSLAGLTAITLVTDEIVVVVAADHPWARRRSVGVRELEQVPFVTREPGSGTRAVAEAALERHGVVLVPTAELASTQSLKRAVLGGGFTLLSRLAVQAEQEAGTLAALPVRGVGLRRDLRAVRVSGAPLPARARQFWAFLAGQAPAAI